MCYHFSTRQQFKNLKQFLQKKKDLTRWVQLIDVNFDSVNWSIEEKFIDIMNQC